MLPSRLSEVGMRGTSSAHLSCPAPGPVCNTVTHRGPSPTGGRSPGGQVRGVRGAPLHGASLPEPFCTSRAWDRPRGRAGGAAGSCSEPCPPASLCLVSAGSFAKHTSQFSAC